MLKVFLYAIMEIPHFRSYIVWSPNRVRKQQKISPTELEISFRISRKMVSLSLVPTPPALRWLNSVILTIINVSVREISHLEVHSSG